MKLNLKLFTIFFLIFCGVNAQRGVFTHSSRVKIKKARTGSATDDVVVRTSTGELRVVPQASVAGAPLTFSQGLTRTGDNIELGGIITSARLFDMQSPASLFYSFSGNPNVTSSWGLNGFGINGQFGFGGQTTGRLSVSPSTVLMNVINTDSESLPDNGTSKMEISDNEIEISMIDATTTTSMLMQKAAIKINSPSIGSPIPGNALIFSNVDGTLTQSPLGSTTAGVGLVDTAGTFNAGGPISTGQAVGYNLSGTGAFSIIDNITGSGLSYQNSNLLLEGGNNTWLRAGEFNTYISAGGQVHLGGDDSVPTGSTITVSNTDLLFKAQYLGDPIPMRIQPQNDLATGQVGQVLTKIADDGTVGWQNPSGIIDGTNTIINDFVLTKGLNEQFLSLSGSWGAFNAQVQLGQLGQNPIIRMNQATSVVALGDADGAGQGSFLELNDNNVEAYFRGYDNVLMPDMTVANGNAAPATAIMTKAWILSQNVVVSTLAEQPLPTTVLAGTRSTVVNDPTPSNNGIYIATGSNVGTNATTWTKI